MRDLHLEIDNYLRERNLLFKRDAIHPFITKVLLPDCSSFSLFDDRWAGQRALVESIITSRSGKGKSVFARKCKILISSKDNLRKFKDFLGKYHFYGNAKAKYYIGLEYNSRLVAVASFSQSRPLPRKNSSLSCERVRNIPKELNPLYKNVCNGILSSPDNCLKLNDADDKIIIVDSYEWVRYASLPGVRVVGGMGRSLKEFERRICMEAERTGGRPYEIMSYADLEFSGGDTYRKLGFLECGTREPVEFAVIADTYERVPLLRLGQKKEDAILYTFFNLGSLKYIKPYNLNL